MGGVCGWVYVCLKGDMYCKSKGLTKVYKCVRVESKIKLWKGRREMGEGSLGIEDSY